VVAVLLDTYGSAVSITFFGASKSFVLKNIKMLSSSEAKFNASVLATAKFTYTEDIHRFGDVLRRSDFLLDMGAWQGSSEMALQAMACGCMPVLPLEGIGDELCSLPTNLGGGTHDSGSAFPPCMALDTFNADTYVQGLVALINTPFRRIGMMESGVLFSKKFSYEQSAAELLYTLNREKELRSEKK
jgi:hypothetical protein